MAALGGGAASNERGTPVQGGEWYDAPKDGAEAEHHDQIGQHFEKVRPFPNLEPQPPNRKPQHQSLNTRS